MALRKCSIDSLESPLAETYYDYSPYCYVANNPIIFIDPDGNKIINTASPGSASYEKIEHSKAIFAKTNPEAYKRLEESPTNVNISVGRINSDDVYKDGYVGEYKGGITNTSYVFDNGVDVKDGKLVMFTTDEERKAQYDAGEDIDYKKEVGFDEAEGHVKVDGDINIIIDETTDAKSKKEFAIVVGHEFGHADFNLSNKAKSLFWSIISGGNAHSDGNPDGENADAVEAHVRKNYNEAKKALKDEEKE